MRFRRAAGRAYGSVGCHLSPTCAAPYRISENRGDQKRTHDVGFLRDDGSVVEQTVSVDDRPRDA